jgi:uncharacterized membrane protein
MWKAVGFALLLSAFPAAFLLIAFFFRGDFDRALPIAGWMMAVMLVGLQLTMQSRPGRLWRVAGGGALAFLIAIAANPDVAFDGIG